jgi:adenylate kinase
MFGRHHTLYRCNEPELSLWSLAKSVIIYVTAASEVVPDRRSQDGSRATVKKREMHEHKVKSAVLVQLLCSVQQAANAQL